METKNIETLLIQLAEKLGTTAEKIWEILLVQAHVTILENILFICAIVFFCKWTWNKIDTLTDDWEKNNVQIVAVIVYFFLIFWCLYGIAEILWCIFNPEYWALERLSEL